MVKRADGWREGGEGALCTRVHGPARDLPPSLQALRLLKAGLLIPQCTFPALPPTWR
jgi:hypothetical protein